MVLPEFLKRNGTPASPDQSLPAYEPTPPPALEEVVASAADGWNSIQKLGDEVRRLRVTNDKLQAGLQQALMRVDYLTEQLRISRHDCSYFERFTTEIVTQFNTIRMLVDDVQNKAVAVARKQEAPTRPPVDLEAEERERLDSLVASLNNLRDPEPAPMPAHEDLPPLHANRTDQS